jgi:hypothetical protein
MELRAISSEDAQTIATLVEALPDIQQPILLICGCQEDHDRAIVYLGRVDGPLAGGGATVELRREQDVWVVAGVGCWVA